MTDNGGDTLPVGTERDAMSSSKSGGVGLRLATLGVNFEGAWLGGRAGAGVGAGAGAGVGAGAEAGAGALRPPDGGFGFGAGR